MKKILLASVFILTACTPDPTVVVRIDCGEHNNQELQVELNGKPSGTCPMDMMIHAGDLTVTARKDNEDASYLYGEAKMTLAENAMKRINLDVQPVYTEEYYFRRAIDVDGIDSYLKYQPQGNRRLELEEKRERVYLNNASDIDGMQTYLKEYPEGKYVKDVGAALASMLSDIEREKEAAEALERKQKEDAEAEIKEKKAKRFASLGFVDNEDGTVTQPSKKLMWMRCSYGQNFKNGRCSGDMSLFRGGVVGMVEDFTYAGHSDWRVPNVDELSSLLYCSKGTDPDQSIGCVKGSDSPTIHEEVFPDTDEGGYWAVSIGKEYEKFSHDNVWVVSFKLGWRHNYYRYKDTPVRLVRNVTK